MLGICAFFFLLFFYFAAFCFIAILSDDMLRFKGLQDS